jgi:SAM-dependent methyltransferase
MGLFGQALNDYHDGLRGEPLFICNQAGEYPLELALYLGDTPYPHEAEILRYARGRVLDVCCGAGRIVKYLRRQGYEVVGLDNDPDVTRLCARQGLTDVHTLSYLQMETLGAFDTVILMNRSIGMAGDLAGVRGLLEKCHASCVPGGRLLYDSYNVLFRDGKEIGETWLAIPNRFRYRGAYSEWFSWVHVTMRGMAPLLAETGWEPGHEVHDGDKYALECVRV